MSLKLVIKNNIQTKNFNIASFKNLIKENYLYFFFVFIYKQYIYQYLNKIVHIQIFISHTYKFIIIKSIMQKFDCLEIDEREYNDQYHHLY